MVYTLVVHLYAKNDPELIGSITSWLKEAAVRYPKDEETIDWFVMQDHLDPRSFTIVARCERESSIQYHLASPFRKSFDDLVIPLLDKPMDLRALTEL